MGGPLPRCHPGVPARGWHRVGDRGAAPGKGLGSVLTVIACVVLVTAGIVGAMKMEDRLEPSRSRKRR